MRITGLEPARVASLEPKSSASANFAISANKKSLWFLLGEGTRGGAITAFIHMLLFYVLFLKKSTVKTNLCKEKKPIPPIIGWNGFFMNQEGFEPPTHGLEGRCSIQLSYRLIKAGDGNRTHVISLEGWSSTIELHPLTVGVTGFEPATSWSQIKRSSQAEPHPVSVMCFCRSQQNIFYYVLLWLSRTFFILF